MGPKLVNCCKPEQMGTKGYGKMLKMIQVLEAGSRQRRQGAGGLKDKREELREKTEACKQVRDGRFHGLKRIMESR